jgi:hypothetical protein
LQGTETEAYGGQRQGFTEDRHKPCRDRDKALQGTERLCRTETDATGTDTRLCRDRDRRFTGTDTRLCRDRDKGLYGDRHKALQGQRQGALRGTETEALQGQIQTLYGDRHKPCEGQRQRLYGVQTQTLGVQTQA